MTSDLRRFCALSLLVGLMLGATGCAVNPATGQHQLSLIGEREEIRLGQQEAQKVAASMPLYPDDALQDYVQEIGERLAARSERPDLAWEFHVVDDTVVNAFALPGGFIYVTRGILAHFNSEAELASVLGHEIGHVTARHSVEQMSRAQLAGIGLGVAMIASPEARAFGDLASQGLGLMFLKFGRDDERQADDLGMRYMVRAGYAAEEMPKVFEMLDRKSAVAGGDIPAWTSTHPDPGNRALRIRQAIGDLPFDQRGGQVDRDGYLRRIDGMPFGEDPRQGLVVENVFYHPELAFRMTFPRSWKIVNQPEAVVAASPGRDAVEILTLSEDGSTEAAARRFFAQEGIESGPSRRGGFQDFRSVSSSGQSGTFRGTVGFVKQDGRVYQLLGYTRSDDWSKHQAAIQQSLGSFERLTDARYLEVESRRIELVELPRSMDLGEFQQRYPSTVDATTLSLINGVSADEVLDPGRLVKRVVGGALPH